MYDLPFGLELRHPFLIARFIGIHETLGWSITKPGFDITSEVVWIEVKDKDLPIDIDPIKLVNEKLAVSGMENAAVFLTAREIRRHHIAQTQINSLSATCVATVGLTNGEFVGMRKHIKNFQVGTINMLVHFSKSLTAGALAESLSIATQARTAAIMDTNHLRKKPYITGTGTDCIIIAAPRGGPHESCAGLHTDVGEAIGSAVYKATFEGAVEWSRENFSAG